MQDSHEDADLTALALVRRAVQSMDEEEQSSAMADLAHSYLQRVFQAQGSPDEGLDDRLTMNELVASLAMLAAGIFAASVEELMGREPSTSELLEQLAGLEHAFRSIPE
jgi:hypothetical protein